MTWVKLDDQWADHPKIIGLSDLAQLLWVKGLTYACRHRTNGFIPIEALPRMLSIRNTKQLEAKIVGRGLWFPCEGGYMIHDFEVYQPVSERLSAARSEAGKKGAAKRWLDPPPTNGNCHPLAMTLPLANDSSRASASGRASDLDLIPDPEGSAEGNRSVEETGYDLAWRLWSEAWSSKYRRSYSLSPDMGLRSEHRVLQRIGDQAKEQANPEAYLAHKYAGYLRDKGDRNYLAEHEHPLRCIERDWNVYGEPKRPHQMAPEAVQRVSTPEPTVDLAEVLKRAHAAAQAGKRSA